MRSRLLARRPSRRPNLRHLVTGALVIIAIGGIAYLLGWDIRAWFSDLWDTLTDISAQYLVAGVVLQTMSSVFKQSARASPA